MGSREEEALAPVRNGVHKISPSLAFPDSSKQLLVLPGSDSSHIGFCFALSGDLLMYFLLVVGPV